MIVRSPQTKEEFLKYYNLRWRILREPWSQPKGSEQDALEGQSIHVMVVENDEVIGIGRAHFNFNEEEQFRYMAVEENWRGKGIGSIILKELEKIAEEKGAKKIILHARENAVKFYKNNGFKIVKPSHTLFGVIPHFLMEKLV